MRNVLDIIGSYSGNSYRYVASTHGGEWAGPCIVCGGKDRFRIQPNYNFNPRKSGGSYWCRQCNISGDGIKYLMDFQGKSFLEACELMGISLSFSRGYHGGVCHERQLQKTGKVIVAPSFCNHTWSKKAEEVLEKSVRYLWSEEAYMHISYLISRGLQSEIIFQFRLGYHKREQYFEPVSWGLQSWRNSRGNPGSICVPAGIVIPMIGEDGRVKRLRIRTDSREGGYPRYTLVKGSLINPLLIKAINHDSRSPVVVVESDLDALLISQKAGDLVSVVSIGSVTYKPDEATDLFLRSACCVLVSLDTDEAGIKRSLSWWLEQYPSSIRLPIPSKYGKDPTEAFCSGLDLRTWIKAGLELVRETVFLPVNELRN